MGVRKLMDFIFSPVELYWLDHMLPGEERIKREDERVSKRLFICLTYLEMGRVPGDYPVPAGYCTTRHYRDQTG